MEIKKAVKTSRVEYKCDEPNCIGYVHSEIINEVMTHKCDMCGKDYSFPLGQEYPCMVLEDIEEEKK
jgi:hypothetical protein